MLVKSASAAGARHYSLCSIGDASNHVNASREHNEKKPAVFPAGLQMWHNAVCHASRIHQLSKRSSAFAHRRRAFDVTRPTRRRDVLLFPTRGLRICLPSSLPIFRSPLLTGNLLSGGFHFLPASLVEAPELDRSVSGSLKTPPLHTNLIPVTQSADGRFPPANALHRISRPAPSCLKTGNQPPSDTRTRAPPS